MENKNQSPGSERRIEAMIDLLTAYYDEAGILSTNFHCPYYEQCVIGSVNLIKGKAAFIGTDYESHSLPRILFVSLDPGSDSSFELPENRTPEGVRAVESKQNWQSFNPLLHWHATHKFAVLIAQIFQPSITYRDANRIFAHTNSAKCCAVKKGNDMSPAVLYKNCRSFLPQELKLLDPDIIIGQGGNAQKAIEFSCADISYQDIYRAITAIHERVRVVMFNDHPVLYIKMIYPSWRNDRTRKQEKELYPYYLNAVKDFTKYFH
jgi:hypothetical protein